jgi:hypothetical protein
MAEPRRNFSNPFAQLVEQEHGGQKNVGKKSKTYSIEVQGCRSQDGQKGKVIDN